MMDIDSMIQKLRKDLKDIETLLTYDSVRKKENERILEATKKNLETSYSEALDQIEAIHSRVSGSFDQYERILKTILERSAEARNDIRKMQ